MKAIALAAVLATALNLSTAVAADDHHPRHGGQVRETASFDLELVAKDRELILYISDHKGQGIETKDATGTATILSGKGKETVRLSGGGKGVLKGAGSLAITADTKIVLSVTASGKTEQARFAPLQKESAADHKGHKH